MGRNIVGDRYSSVHRTLKFFIIELKQTNNCYKTTSYIPEWVMWVRSITGQFVKVLFLISPGLGSTWGLFLYLLIKMFT